MEQTSNVEKKEKIYPENEDEIQTEKEIIELIKKAPIEQRLQLAVLNNILLAKKQVNFVAYNKIEEIVKQAGKQKETLYKEVNAIVSGERAPTQEELADAKALLKPEEVEKLAENLTATPFEDYWFKVLTACVRFEGQIFDVDHPLLKKITKIESFNEEETMNFTVTFHFAENDYFTNTTLSLKVFMLEDEVPEKIESTEIQWKEGKNITQKTISKRKKNKKTGKHTTVQKIVDADSLFAVFKNIDLGADKEGDDEKDEKEEEDDEALAKQQKLQEAYEFALTIQEEILIYHIEYLVGKRKGDEQMGMDGGFNYGDFDEEDIPLPPPKKGGKGGKK